MNRSVYAIAAILLTSRIAAAEDAKTAPAPGKPEEAPKAAQTQPTSTPPSTPAPAASSSEPKIVVHQDTAPANTSDGRVSVGGLRISMPAWDGAPAQGESGSPARSDGTIAVPDNTLGPGEALWQRREREDADRKFAAAEADLARAAAQRAENIANADRGYSFLGGGYYTGGGYFSGGWRSGYPELHGLRGPLVTTITHDDSLGSTAQRAYAEAAYPRLNGTTEARDEAVRRFGRDATPPIARIQDDVDRAHLNAHKEQPTKP